MPFRKPSTHFLLLIVFASFVVFASCETGDPGCYQPTVVSGVCGFQARDTQIVADTVSLDPFVTVNRTIFIFHDSLMDSPEMKVLNEDTVLLARGQKGASALGIAFNQAKDSIRYTFRTDTTSAVYDTITFRYNSTLHFISNNCGYNYYFGLQSVSHTTHMIDSFAWINKNITETVNRNVQFYFKRTF